MLTLTCGKKKQKHKYMSNHTDTWWTMPSPMSMKDGFLLIYAANVSW